MNKIIDRMTRASVDAKTRPTLQLSTPHGDLVLTLMGFRSRFPGSVSLSSSRRFGQGRFYGYLHKESGLDVRDDLAKEWIEKILTRFEEDPEALALDQSRITSQCMFCGLELTSPISVVFGYGPICAERWGLRWEMTPEIEKSKNLEKYRLLLAKINQFNISNS